jgi:Putative MetA-pathway of phenol degradation
VNVAGPQVNRANKKDGHLMNTVPGLLSRAFFLRWIALAVVALGALCPLQAQSQVPPRFYWKTLSGANAVPLIVTSMSGNTNPFDPALTVIPGADFESTLILTGYARTFALFDRAAMGAVLLPMGRISGDVITPGGVPVSQSVSGFGDPTVEFTLNVIGPKAQKNLQDASRFEPGFSLDVLADLAFPIGEYDSSQPLNIGQNRWYGRIGFPIVWQIGEWVPGRRTTLEFLPAVWLFGDNTDYLGQTLEADPLYQIDAHLTRDFTANLWGSLDAVLYNGGKTTIDGVEGSKLNNYGFGLTLGYQINDNVALTFSYKSTASDQAPDDLQMDVIMISLVSGWHPIIEGAKRLKSE